MTREGLTEKLLDIKREKGWTWKYICGEIGGMSLILITGAILGQMKLTKLQAANAAKLFGLSKSEQVLLNEVPFRGTGTPMPPTDPLIYRFYELIMVNGPALKALIEEEFGDGIMSAIDFDMDITRKADPKGDRVWHDRKIPALQILWRDRQRARLRSQRGLGPTPARGEPGPHAKNALLFIRPSARLAWRIAPGPMGP
jgi:cyanate lyase